MTTKDFQIQQRMATGHYPPTHPCGNSNHMTTWEYANFLEEELVKLMNQKGIIRPGKSSTCDFCADSGTCQFAFDAYNTDGDCLATK